MCWGLYVLSHKKFKNFQPSVSKWPLRIYNNSKFVVHLIRSFSRTFSFRRVFNVACLLFSRVQSILMFLLTDGAGNHHQQQQQYQPQQPHQRPSFLVGGEVLAGGASMPEDFLLNYKDDILMEEDERLAEDFLHLQQRLQLLENGTNDRQRGEEQKKLI